MAEPDVVGDQEAVDTTEPPPSPPPPRRHRVRKLAFRLLAVIIAVVVTLGLVEIVFRVLGYQPLTEVYAKPDSFYVADPMVGWAYRPGVTGEFVGPQPYPITFRTRVRINSLGLRGPEVAPVPPGGLRVLVLGDSITSGLEVEENQTYSSVAGRLLSERLGVPVQIINAGVRGYGTDQELLLYRERLTQLHPDVVVVHENATDPGDNITMHRMRRVYGKPAFVLGPDNTLHLVGRPVPDYPRCSEYHEVDGVVRRIDSTWPKTMCWLQMNLANNSAFFSFVEGRLQRNPALVRWLYSLGTYDDSTQNTPAPGPSPMAAPASPASPAAPPQSAPAPAPPPPPPYGLHLTSALITQMADDVRHNGGRFVLMGQDGDLQKLDADAFDRDGIPLIRIDAAFSPEVLIPNDGHPNAAGHQRIGELLTDQIEPVLRQVMASR